MPALPWTTLAAAAPTTPCVVMASRLPLSSYRHIPAFLLRSEAIRRQLATAPGLLGYSLQADLAHKTFWTLSAWTDRAALLRFNAADPHRKAARATRPAMQPPAFVFWTATAGDLPIAWAEARRRLAEVRFSVRRGRPAVSAVGGPRGTSLTRSPGRW